MSYATDKLREAMREVERRPCSCVICDECHGSGNMMEYDPSGFYEPYGCESCDGNGIIEVCDRCLELEELLECLDETEYREMHAVTVPRLPG